MVCENHTGKEFTCAKYCPQYDKSISFIHVKQEKRE